MLQNPHPHECARSDSLLLAELNREPSLDDGVWELDLDLCELLRDVLGATGAPESCGFFLAVGLGRLSRLSFRFAICADMYPPSTEKDAPISRLAAKSSGSLLTIEEIAVSS